MVCSHSKCMKRDKWPSIISILINKICFWYLHICLMLDAWFIVFVQWRDDINILIDNNRLNSKYVVSLSALRSCFFSLLRRRHKKLFYKGRCESLLNLIFMCSIKRNRWIFFLGIILQFFSSKDESEFLRWKCVANDYSPIGNKKWFFLFSIRCEKPKRPKYTSMMKTSRRVLNIT